MYWSYGTDATWNGSSSSITFTPSAQTRLTQIVVTYTTVGSHTLSSEVLPIGGGTVSLSSTSVIEGATITAAATPNPGYGFTGWTITGTGATLSSSSDNPTTVTMGTSDATITAHFEILTPHTVTFDACVGSCATTSLVEASGGAGVVLPAAAPPSCVPAYSFYGWATVQSPLTSNAPTIVGTAGGTYYPSTDITLYAVYVLYSGDYKKITASASSWEGQCLIVYEAGSVAFDGSLATLDAVSNIIPVTITSSTIESNSTTDASSFVISKVGSTYNIRSASGKYIGRTVTTNGMNVDVSTPYTNTISHNGTSILITSPAGPSLQYNPQSNQTRFRYFASSQGIIQLYRRRATYDSNPSCTCPAISNLSASSITTNSASLSWTAGGSEPSWSVVVSPGELPDPSTGTIIEVTSTGYNATGLSAGTTYYAYVRAKCAANDFSGWSLVQFETPCSVERTATLNSTAETLAPGRNFDLVLNVIGGGSVTWSSSNNRVATVDDNGRVHAVAEGHCVINAIVEQNGAYCSTAISCNIYVATDDCVRIGWGTSESVNGTYCSAKYSYSQQVYTADEIRIAGGVAGLITDIKVHHGNANISTTSNVYMGITTEEDLSEEWVQYGMVQVVDNKLINYSQGWTNIHLDTPFDWDGEGNIVVAFKNVRSDDGSSVHCITHSIGNSNRWTYKYRSCYNGSSAIGLNSSFVPSSEVGSTGNRPNMKFCITPCENNMDAYFSEDEMTIRIGGGNVPTTLTTNPGDGVTITYTSNNPSVATVSDDGKVSPIAVGSAIIIAHVTKAGYCSANAYLTVNVCDCASGDRPYQVGDESNQESIYGPVCNSSAGKNSYRQIIYRAGELHAGIIKKIAFHYAYSSAMTKKTNVTIYMATTDIAEYSSTTGWVAHSEFTQVFSGELNCSQGWNTFELSTPYTYDGCKNLVVAIEDKSNNYDMSSYKFYYSNSVEKVQLYYNSNSNYQPNLSNLNIITGIMTTYYPNTRFCIEQESGASTHTLSYDINSNCTVETTPAEIEPVSSVSEARVTGIIPQCSDYTGFRGWNTKLDGSGIYYYADDNIKLCDDITLYAIYNDEVHGESSCENAVAFCNSNTINFHVESGSGESYGDFCNFFETPATWWYMQIDHPGDIMMTISSTAGDVDFACWGPFPNKTCDLADLSDEGAYGYDFYNGETGAPHHALLSGSPAPQHSNTNSNNAICTTLSLARPSGNLVDYGGSTSAVEYLQIFGAQRGDYYVIIVANYQNGAGNITFEQTGGDATASCDIVNNCDITSISATPNCTSTRTYDVSGEIAFRDAPVDADATLVITDGTHSHTFTPPFSSPTPFSFTGLPANGEEVSLTATFTSSTINCSKTSSYTAPTKISCGFDPLPVELLSLHATCNGKRALITWTTASEHNNDYFVVERSDDAINFVEVGRVAGAGNSIEMLSYNYADYSIRTGENYYRLTQVDYDGTRTTSEIIEVHCSGNVPLGDPDVYVYPNPFGDELTVHLVNFGDVAAHIQVYDMLGRMLFERTADDTEVVLQLGALPDAAYTVRVSTADFVVNKKVVKNN